MNEFDDGAGAWPVEASVAPRSADGRELSRKGERTRESLLAAAEEVFGDVGYHDASNRAHHRAAGVAQGTFYRYFTSQRPSSTSSWTTSTAGSARR